MRFSDLVNEGDFLNIRELAPTMAPPAAPAAGATTLAPGQQVATDPAAQAKMMAQQALDKANQRKQLQDQIKQTQSQLIDLQKQLAAIK